LLRRSAKAELLAMTWWLSWHLPVIASEGKQSDLHVKKTGLFRDARSKQALGFPLNKLFPSPFPFG
jgi:hypothetical protein